MTGARNAWTVWIGLTAITLVAWLIAPGHTGNARNAGSGLIAVIAVLGLIKCRLIIRYFMEVRYAPAWLRIATDAWLAILWLTLLGAYLY